MDWVNSFDNFYYYLFSKYYKNKNKNKNVIYPTYTWNGIRDVGFSVYVILFI